MFNVYIVHSINTFHDPPRHFYKNYISCKNLLVFHVLYIKYSIAVLLNYLKRDDIFFNIIYFLIQNF